MDTTRLGQVTAELMDLIAEEYGDTEGAELGIVAVVAEIDVADGDEGWTTVQYRCSDQRRWIQSGLFAAAERGVRASSQERDDDD